MQKSAYFDYENEKHLTIWENVNINALLLEFYNDNDFDLAQKRVLANHKKCQRMRRDISLLLEKDCVFLTLTFNNDFINNTEEYIRKCIKNYLNSLGCNYLCNVDYGEKNGRLHYHAIIQMKKLDRDKYPYNYGAINFERIRRTKDSLQLSHYINKLVNHAKKETTRNTRVLKKIV